jgi:carboxypeptidase-like protein/flagellar hook capping protein FlgD/MAM domain-containing protein meprin/A5/mu
MRKLLLLFILIASTILTAETVLDEDFETAVLPEGWSQEFVDGTVNWSYSNGGYNAHPGSAYDGFFNARFFNGSTDGASTKLVTQEFNLGINQVGTLTFYHAQQSWVGYQDELSVYYKNSPEGEWIFLVSFTESTTDWTLRQVVLPSPSTTYYLAFEGFAEYGYGVCIDDVHVDGDPMYDYDLQGYSIDGPQNVTAGNSESYAVTILNAGINPVPEYTVTLYREGDIVISSVDFDDEIGTGAIETRYVVWNIPEVEPETYTYIYAIVSFEEDENIYNNATDNFNIHILPQGTEYLVEADFEEGEIPQGWSQEYVNGTNDWIVQTGGGDGNPAGAHGGEYNAAFLHSTTGYITKLISPNFNLGTANNGTINFWHAQAEWASDLDQLRIYYRNAPASPWTQIETFTANTPDWTERNVTLPNPSTTYSVAFEAVDGFGYGVCLDDIVIIGQPTVYDNDLSGQFISGATIVNAGNSEIYQVLIKNVGDLPQDSYTVKLFKLGNEELASIDINETIQPGEIVPHNLQWNIPADEIPGTTVLYGGVELAGDENPGNDLTSTLAIEIFPQGIIEVLVGEGTELNNRLPVCFQYMNSLTESIYLSSELNNVTGFINAITYYNSFTSNLQHQPTAIWMGETTLATLIDGWIPATQLTQVYDANVNYPPGDNEITINLTTPYFYGGDNLVVMVHRPFDTNIYGTSDYFYLTETLEIMDRTRYERDDVLILDPNAPPEGYSFEKFPNTKFTFFQGTMGDVTGYIYNEIGEPLDGATITVEQTQQIGYADENGMFFLGNILTGTYEFTASAFGYTPQTLTGEVLESEILELTFNLVPLGVVNVSGTVSGSDFPGIGLEGALISLSGFDTYQTYSNADGQFAISEVYANLTYDIEVSHNDYETYTGEISVGGADLDLGNIILNEFTDPPTNVYGEENPDGISVDLSWSGPGVGGSEFRYDDGEVTGQIGFSNTPANAVFGAVHNNNAIIEEIHWYLTSTFGAHNNAKLILLGLDGSGQPDHNQLLLITENLPNTDNQWNVYVLNEPVAAPNGFLVGVITPNTYTGIGLDDGVGAPWEFVAGTQLATENWTSITEEWTDIGEFNFSQNMMIRAYGLDYGIINSPDLQVNNNSREFEAYAVYRFLHVYQSNQNYWDLLAETVLDTAYTDNTWGALNEGEYQYAVTSVHTNGVESIPSFSNIVTKTTPADADDQMQPFTNALFNNVPNPFNPETVISFQVYSENEQDVELMIYNIKGQKIKTFEVNIHPELDEGRRSVTWTGTDDDDQPVPSGIYFYKLKAGDYTKTKKMLLLK